ncbi:MAG: hypothetical protein ACO1G9_08195 [Bacteroidota bacterium]
MKKLLVQDNTYDFPQIPIAIRSAEFRRKFAENSMSFKSGNKELCDISRRFRR